MAEKKIQVRIRQKVDTKANWDKATNFVPLKGEYIYYSDLHRVKVGDGVTKVGSLPFLADSDSHYTTHAYVGATNANSNAATTNGNTYLKVYDDSTKRAEFKIIGSGATKVSSDASGNITISSTDTNTDSKVTSAANHYTPTADSSAQLSVDASSTTAATWNSTSLVTGVNLQRDAKGHVTGVTVDSIKMPANPNTDTNTHYTTGLYIGASNVKANAATTNGTTYLKAYDDNTKRAEFLIKGSGATSVSSDANGNITISSTDTNTHQSVADKNPTLAWGTKSAVATIGSTNIHVTMPANPVPSNYVTTNTKQTITGEKTFNAPATASGEQATAIFKTANGGQIIFGKEGSNSGSMIALDQVAGTRRLNFRASATPGTIVWSQPESGSSLYYDVSNVYFRECSHVSFDSASTIMFNKFANASALGTDTYGNLKKVSLAKVATSGSYNDLSNKPTNFATTTQLDNKLDKNNASGTGSFTWTGPDKSPLDVKFNVKNTQAAAELGCPAEVAAMSLSANAFGPVTLELFTHDTASDVAIKLNQEGNTTTIGVNGITTGGGKNLSWPAYGGTLLTYGYLADRNATDPSANDGKIPALEYPGTIPLKFIKPMVSMYASESAFPGAVHFSPYYVPYALYVATDTNSIYRYNEDTESYVKLGADVGSISSQSIVSICI